MKFRNIFYFCGLFALLDPDPAWNKIIAVPCGSGSAALALLILGFYYLKNVYMVTSIISYRYRILFGLAIRNEWDAPPLLSYGTQTLRILILFSRKFFSSISLPILGHYRYRTRFCFCIWFKIKKLQPLISSPVVWTKVLISRCSSNVLMFQ